MGTMGTRLRRSNCGMTWVVKARAITEKRSATMPERTILFQHFSAGCLCLGHDGGLLYFYFLQARRPALRVDGLGDVGAGETEAESGAAGALGFDPHVAAVIQDRLARQGQQGVTIALEIPPEICRLREVASAACDALAHAAGQQ